MWGAGVGGWVSALRYTPLPPLGCSCALLNSRTLAAWALGQRVTLAHRVSITRAREALTWPDLPAATAWTVPLLVPPTPLGPVFRLSQACPSLQSQVWGSSALAGLSCHPPAHPCLQPGSHWLPCFSSGAELAISEAGGPDRHGNDLYTPVEESLLGAGAGCLGPPLTPEKDEALQQAAAVANLRAALMSKNSLLSLKADVLGEERSLLLECLPRGAHSLSRECLGRLRWRGEGRAEEHQSLPTAQSQLFPAVGWGCCWVALSRASPAPAMARLL